MKEPGNQVAEAPPISPPPPRLPFTLEFREGKAMLVLEGHELVPGLTIERLVLEVPTVSFPFDLHGDASQFRHHRTRLRELVFSAGREWMAASVAGDSPQGKIENPRVALEPGFAVLSGTFSVGNHRTPFTARFLAEPAGRALRVAFFEIRFFGWQPVPPAALVGALLPSIEKLQPKRKGASIVLVDPLRMLLMRLLPPSGWKLPECREVRASSVAFSGGRVRIGYSATHAGIHERPSAPFVGRYAERLVAVLEGTDMFDEAEQLLTEGKYERALQLYLEKSGQVPSHPLALERCVELCAIYPARLQVLEEIVQRLQRKDGLAASALLNMAAAEWQAGNLTAAAEAYERAAGLLLELEEHGDAAESFRKAVALYHKTGNATRATDCAEKLVALEPQDTAAMASLAESYEKQNNWYRAARHWLRLARTTTDPRTFAECHHRIGRIFLERLDNIERAGEHLSLALMQEPDYTPALVAMADINRHLGKDHQALMLLQRALASVPEDQLELAITLRQKMADLWLALDQPENALAQLEAILEKQPLNLAALQQAAQIAESLQKWEQAADLFSQLVAHHIAGKPVPRSAVRQACLSLAEIYQRLPGAEREALSHLERAFELDESDMEVLERLVEYHRRHSNWARLAELLCRQAELEKSEGKAIACMLEAAQIFDRNLGDPSQAAELLRKALERDPWNPEIVESLSELLERQEKWSELAALLEEAAERNPSHRSRPRWLARLARLHADRLGAPGRAIDFAIKAVEANPKQGRLLLEFLPLARKPEFRNTLEPMFELVSRAELDDQTMLDLAIERAELMAELEKPLGERIAAWQKVLELDPNHLAAHRALSDLAESAGDLAMTRKHTEKVLEIAGEGGLTEPAKTDLLRRLARIADSEGELERALELYRAVLGRHPRDGEAQKRIEELLRRLQKWDELAAFYASQAEQYSGQKAASLHAASASLWWERLGKFEQAEYQYEKAIEADPESPAVPARLNSLQRMYVAQGRWDKVAEVLERRAALAPSGKRARLLVALAGVAASRLEDDRAARDALTEARKIDPTYRPAALMLARLYLASGQLQDALVQARDALSAETDSPPLPARTRSELALQVAAAAWDAKLLDDARWFYREHIEANRDREFVGVEPEAWERLELILRKEKDHIELARLYHDWLRFESAPDKITSLTRSLAILQFEHLDMPQEAVQSLERLHERNPDDLPTIELLVDMYGRSGRYEKLAGLLENNWQRPQDTESKLKWLELLADTYQFRLFELDRAMKCWLNLYELGHPRAAEQLEILYRQEGRWRQLVDLLLDRADYADGEQALQLWWEIFEIATTRLDDRELARVAIEKLSGFELSHDRQKKIVLEARNLGDDEFYARLLAVVADNEQSPSVRFELLAEHARICLDGKDERFIRHGLESLEQALDISADEELAELGLRHYRKLGEWERAIDLLELLVQHGNPEKAADYLLQMADIYEHELDAPERAAAAIEEALNRLPEEMADERLEQLARAARLYDEQNVTGKAIECYERLWKLKPGDIEAGTRLAALYRSTGKTVELARVQEVLARSQPPDVAADSLVEAAELFLEAGDEDSATRALRAALANVPHHRRAVEVSLQRMVEKNQLESALDLLETLPEGMLSEKKIAALASSCAEGLAESEDGETALRAQKLAMKLRPGDPALKLEAARLCDGLERVGEAEKLWRELEGQSEQLEPEQRKELWLRLARLEFAQGNSEHAERFLRSCIDLDPADRQVREFLHRILRESSKYEEEAQLLIDEAGHTSDIEQKLQMLMEAAALLDEKVGKPSEAARLYRECLQMRGDDENAWRRLEDIYRRLDKQEERLEALENLALIQLEKGSADVARQAARAAMEMERWDRAEHLLERVIELEPHDRQALAWLAGCARQRNDLEQFVVWQAQFVELVEDPATRVEALERLADVLLEEMNQPERALVPLEQLADLRPGDPLVIDRLERVYRELDRKDGLERLLEHRLELAKDNPPPELLCELAGLKMERQGQAEAALRLLLQIDPDRRDLETWRLLGKAALDADSLEHWAEALEQIALKDDRAGVAELETAALAAWHVERYDRAAELFELVLEASADNPVAHRFLVHFHSANPRKAAENIKWLLGHANLLPPAEELVLRRMLVAAMAEAEHSQKIEALEQLLGHEDDLEAALELSGLYGAAGRHAEQAELLERCSRWATGERVSELRLAGARAFFLAGAEKEALAILDEIARTEPDRAGQVWQLLQEFEPDAAKYPEVFEIASNLSKHLPEELNLLKLVASLALDQHKPDVAEKVLRKLADRAPYGERAGHLVELGRVLAGLGRTQEARQVLERAIELDPSLEQAFASLGPIMEGEDVPPDHKALFFGKWADAAAGAARRAELLLQSARWHEKAGQREQACERLWQLLELEPENIQALEMLAALLSSLERWEQLLDVLARRLKTCDEAKRRAAFAFEMGQVCKEHLKDIDRAAGYFEQSLALVGDFLPAIEELADIHYRAGRLNEAAELYQRLVDTSDSADKRFGVTLRRAEIADRLGENEKAIELYERVNELDPGFIPAHQRLVELYRQAGNLDAQARHVERLLDIASREGFDELERDCLEELARLCESRLQFDRAFELYAALLEKWPEHRMAATRARQFLVNRGDWAAAQDAIEKELGLCDNAEERAALHELLADIRLNKLADSKGAAASWQEALRTSPGDEGLIERAFSAAREAEDPELTITLCQALLDITTRKELKREIHIACAMAYRKTGRQKEALAQLEKLFELGPVAAGYIETAAELSRQLGDWQRWCSYYGQVIEARAASGVDAEDLVQAYLSLASVYQQKLGLLEQAAACVLKALEISPRDRELLRMLGTIWASSFDTLPRAIAVFRELAGADPTDPQNYRYLARLEAARGKADRTACYYSGLRLLVPSDEEAKRYLEHCGPVLVPSRQMDEQLWTKTLLHPSADCLLQRIMSICAPYIEPIFPSDANLLAKFSEPEQARHGELLLVLQQTCTVFGCRPSRIMLGDLPDRIATLETGPPVTVLLDRKFVENSPPAQVRFALASQLVLAGMGHALSRKLRLSDMETLLALLGKMIRPDWRPHIDLPATAPQYIEVFDSNIPPGIKQQLEPLLRRYIIEPRAHDIQAWQAGALMTADRAGLLMCGDLIAAMEVLCRQSSAAGGKELAFITNRGALLEADPRLMDLFRFSFSEAYFSAREFLGIGHVRHG